MASMTGKTVATLLGTVFSMGAGMAASQAATIAALQDGKTIVWIDTDQKKVTGSATIDGGLRLVGIDVRPSDGKLYGLASDGAIVTVDPKSGKTEKVSQLSEKLTDGGMHSVDFNPVADRLRVISSTGVSLRINVADGKATVDGSLKYAEADSNKGKTPKVGAVAYTNSFAGAKETTLFNIDAANGAFVRQAPPNDGILNTVGMTGIKADTPVAFDIWSDGKGGNSGWVVSGGKLHALDLITGMVKAEGEIAGLNGKVDDIAILPAM